MHIAALASLITGARRPGLGRRGRVPSLHPNRNPNPTVRAPLIVARSKADQKADAELDSDEERARANETPAQRMRRKIREAEEDFMEPPAGWEKDDRGVGGSAGGGASGGWDNEAPSRPSDDDVAPASAADYEE